MTGIATLIATWFGSGWLPKAPGTWGSLAALPFAWAIVAAGAPPPALCVAALLLLPLGAWAAAVHSSRLGTHDAGEIVVDEIAGQWLVLAAAPLSPLGWFAAFLLFRLFDIVKPWPISWMDKHIGGGWGIMLDDVAAGVFGAVTLWIIVYFAGSF
ncbi:MAG: phosphatidylglycerophosphatase A [Parvibaculaceae bacterium]